MSLESSTNKLMILCFIVLFFLIYSLLKVTNTNHVKFPLQQDNNIFTNYINYIYNRKSNHMLSHTIQMISDSTLSGYSLQKQKMIYLPVDFNNSQEINNYLETNNFNINQLSCMKCHGQNYD